MRHINVLIRSYSLTWAEEYGFPINPYRVILEVDCSQLPAPPKYLCRQYTGLDPEIADSFFSVYENENTYQRALDELELILGSHRRRRSLHSYVMVLVSCRAGMHRIVAMAEELAEELGKWEAIRVKCEHYDLEDRIRARRERRWQGVSA